MPFCDIRRPIIGKGSDNPKNNISLDLADTYGYFGSGYEKVVCAHWFEELVCL
jgi:hypothetical protein